MAQILIVSEGVRDLGALSIALREHAHEVSVIRPQDLGPTGGLGSYELILATVSPGRLGCDLYRELRGYFRDADVVLFSPQGTLEDAVESVRLGARDYVCKHADAQSVIKAVENTLGSERVPSDRIRSETQVDDPFAAIKGNSRKLKELLSLVSRVAQTESTVLITGETGTGKELIGAAIHKASRRHKNVFSAVNSAAFPETLLESELFGHRRGAFTGAAENKTGLFESAHRGTVFLDEVAEMPLSMQAKLLRFLQTGEIRPVGSSTTRRVDIRLVAATNKDLEREVSSGRFREDLYYRLAVIPVEVIPLRERPEDIALLATHFLHQFSTQLGKNVIEIAPEALDLMQRYSWPGNVRELRNCIERAIALCRDHRIGLEEIPRALLATPAAPIANDLTSLRTLERSHILSTLEHVGWNRKRAAEILEISTTTLWRRLKTFGLDGPEGPMPLG